MAEVGQRLVWKDCHICQPLLATEAAHGAAGKAP